MRRVQLARLACRARRNPVRAPLQAFRRGRRARVVEAHPVDQRPVGRQPEQPGSRIARLSLGRHRADLHEREPERAEYIGAPGVLVEPGGQPQRPRQVEPERSYPQHRVARREPPPQQPVPARHRARDADQPEPGRVRRLRRETPQQHPVHQPIHGSMVALTAAVP